MLTAASGVISASSCLRGMPVLPGASSWVYGTAVGSVALVAEVGVVPLVAASDSMLQTQRQAITKTKRSKI